MIRNGISVLALLVLAACIPLNGQTGVPSPLYGVTVDDVSNLPDILTSLSKLPHKPTTRIVFDEYAPASRYIASSSEIHKVSYVMGEILDSYFFKDFSIEDYLNRTSEYLNALGDSVDIWEVGNEINGDWLGKTPDVVAKMTGAYDRVKAAGKTTELTLDFHPGCAKYPENEMFTWAQANIPDRMKQGLDYVLVSYYEDHCKGFQPDWQPVFERLAAMFPKAKLGIGECGTSIQPRKAEYIKRYYTMRITVPGYVGGYFWWWYRRDMVPYTKPLWSILNDAMSASSLKEAVAGKGPGAADRF